MTRDVIIQKTILSLSRTEYDRINFNDNSWNKNNAQFAIK